MLFVHPELVSLHCLPHCKRVFHFPWLCCPLTWDLSLGEQIQGVSRPQRAEAPTASSSSLSQTGVP